MSEENVFPEPDLDDLKEFSKWKNWELDEFASVNLSPDMAIATTRIFFPEFFVYCDCVFRGKKPVDFKHKFEDSLDSLHGDLGAIERLFNHRHIVQDFAYPFLEKLNTRNVKYFATILKHTWQAALVAQFPERAFRVEMNHDEDIDDYILFFWQPKHDE